MNEANQLEVVASPKNYISAGAEAEIQRAIAEVQGAIILAKRFPRNTDGSLAEILSECKRVALAEVATYEYSKGGTKIDGPTIRLAEVLSLAWTNLHSSWQELDRKIINGVPYAEIETQAWDLERNRRESVKFKVKLIRDTKKGSWPLKDEREIYEQCANQAKRRERACILSLIPGYVIDQAVEACNETLRRTVTPETTAKMIAAFEDNYNVSVEQIEGFIQRKIDAIMPTQVVRLRKIYNSLKDGMSQASEWFGKTNNSNEPENIQESGRETVKKKLKKKDSPETEAQMNYGERSVVDEKFPRKTEEIKPEQEDIFPGDKKFEKKEQKPETFLVIIPGYGKPAEYPDLKTAAESFGVQLDGFKKTNKNAHAQDMVKKNQEVLGKIKAGYPDIFKTYGIVTMEDKAN